ncbi:hypothetical protein LCGC14_2706700 [marine sediment metagenome]|uniref:Uncharacterized protein n=1 Tax=marine sediment metagenome TaxID=412755 RepID=A0A0F8ZE89_9ZZZZ
MPIYSNDVPERPRGPALPIRRTPARTPLDAIVTSDDLIGCYTHFYKGSTVPCEGDQCKPHHEGIPFRWHAYMTCVELRSNLHFLFEVTANAAEHFVAYRNIHNTIRSCQFRAVRWNQRHNGRILIQTKTASLGQRMLPPAPDLEKCLAVLWGLPSGNVTVKGINPETQVRQVHTEPEKDEFECPQ